MDDKARGGLFLGLHGLYQFTQLNRTGLTRVAGYTDEPANVTVNGIKPGAWSLPGGRPWAFDIGLSLASGNSNVTISATDAGNTVTTHSWTVVTGGTAANFTYDANGDMLQRVNDPGAGGNLTTSSNYTWDGLGRLLTAKTGNTTVTFGYDGLGRRVSLSANVSGNVTNEYYLWDGDQIVEKRLGGNTSANIIAAYYTYGFQTRSGNTTVTGNYFYTKDHLGSIREITGNDGVTVEGRYSYGPWGETIYLDYSGGAVAQPQFGYAGYFQTNYLPNLYFTKYRAYYPVAGRWLSRDPIGEAGGVNLYGYVGNSPIDAIDRSGKLTFNFNNSTTIDIPPEPVSDAAAYTVLGIIAVAGAAPVAIDLGVEGLTYVGLQGLRGVIPFIADGSETLITEDPIEIVVNPDPVPIDPVEEPPFITNPSDQPVPTGPAVPAWVPLQLGNLGGCVQGIEDSFPDPSETSINS